jgi:hypothetical protein
MSVEEAKEHAAAVAVERAKFGIWWGQQLQLGKYKWCSAMVIVDHQHTAWRAWLAAKGLGK